MNKKLIISDLDGTLLNRKKNIGQEDQDYLFALRMKGHLFTLATSRYYRSILRYVRELGLNVPVIASNGSLVYDFMNGEIIYCNPLSENVIETVDAIYQKEKMALIAHGVHDMYITEGHKRLSFYEKNNTFLLPEDRFYPKITNSFKGLNDEIYQFGIVSENTEAYRKALMKELKNERVKVLLSGKDTLVIVPETSSKANATKHLLKRFSLTVNDLIVFGDDENDEELIRFAEHSAVPENAIPSLKSMAEYVTLSNEENGVSYALKNYYGL